MTTAVEKRKAFLINVVYVLFFIAAFYLFMKYVFGAVFPLIAAFVIALILQKPVNFFQKKCHIPRGIASTVISLFCFFIIFAFLFFLGAKAVDEVKDFIASITAGFENLSGMVAEIKDWILGLGIIKKLPAGLKSSVISSVTNFFNGITSAKSSTTVDTVAGSSKIDLSILSTPLSGVWSTAKQIPSILVAFLITIVASCFMTADYPKVREFIYRQLSDEKSEKFTRAKVVLAKSVSKILKAYALIILITTTELFIGLEILSICKIYQGGYILIISIIIAFIDIVPVLGTGTVIIPWAIYSFITDSVGMGIGLIVLYVIILIIRQIIEPKLVAGQVDMSPIVTISAMYIGTKFLGVLGIFILPFLCIVIKLLNDEGIIHIFKSKKAENEIQKTTDIKSE